MRGMGPYYTTLDELPVSQNLKRNGTLAQPSMKVLSYLKYS